MYSDVNSLGFKLPYNINSHVAIYGTYTYVDGVKYENVKMSDVLREISETIEQKSYDFEKSELGCDEVEAGEELTSDYIYSQLQGFLKEDDIIFSEIGLVPYGIFGLKLPKSVSFNVQALWCSIGWATPAAFGAGMAKPNSRIVLVTGDGAHQISALEVGNMLKYGLKPVIIVINNNGYTIERMLSGKFDNEFNDIVNINYSKLARIFDGDIWSTRVNTAEDFEKALRVTAIMKKLCYIEACVDKSDSPAMARAFLCGNKIEQPKRKVKQKKEVKLSKNIDAKYSTIVHESLQIEE